MSFFTANCNHLYLKAWEYNAVLIIDELRTIVENNGGTVKPSRHTGTIENRSVTSYTRETADRLNRLEEAEKNNPGANEHRTQAIKDYRAMLEKLDSIGDTTRHTPGESWITFELDGTYYNIDIPDNPFFDVHMWKTPIANGKRNRDAEAQDANREWMFDCFFGVEATDADRREAANLLFNAMVKAPMSTIRREYNYRMVANTYNNGYHRERVYKPSSYETLEWLHQDAPQPVSIPKAAHTTTAKGV